MSNVNLEELKRYRERIAELEDMLEEVEEQLEESAKEIKRLKEENEWMHDTIWDLTRKLRKIPAQKDEEN
ncbi:MAG: hypothetical protein MSG78_06915 [Clostridiales bacterium]|nr:hypothetical protein [Clostridiales bacterium]